MREFAPLYADGRVLLITVRADSHPNDFEHLYMSVKNRPSRRDAILKDLTNLVGSILLLQWIRMDHYCTFDWPGDCVITGAPSPIVTL